MRPKTLNHARGGAGLSALTFLLAACGATIPVPAAHLSAQGAAAPATKYMMAEASGRIGAWASGRIGAWASSTRTSTALDGRANTFEDNLPMWTQVRLAEAQRAAPELGGGVKVAVIDTGIDLTHPAFQNHLVPAAEMNDFVDHDGVPQEMGTTGNLAYGHGTAVASLILQIAPNATILPVRVLGPDGSALPSAVAAGIDWAVGQGATVINLSVVSHTDASLSVALKNAADRGIYIVMAAGNEGTDPPLYPAKFAQQNNDLGGHSLSVGSIDIDNLKSDFSNYGAQLKVLAPGRLLTVAFPDNRVAQATGTSFATPVVAGVLALGAGRHVSSTASLTEVLKNSETNVDAYNMTYGGGLPLPYGLLNAQSFVNNVR
jgi:thermitase